MFGALLLTLTAAGPAVPGDMEDLRFYEESVRPILAENCNRCHGEGRVRAGLDLVRFEGLDEGRIVPGKPDESLLYTLASGAGEKRMPPQGPQLDATELAVLRTWIEAGAQHPEVEAHAARFQVLPGDRESWAFCR
jgi:mono/diheme cytochrome c family protein